MEVYHKEQLFTKEEAKKAAPNIWRWRAVAVTKDVTATQIADILDKYGFNDVARHIRGKCVYTLVSVYKYSTGSL